MSRLKVGALARFSREGHDFAAPSMHVPNGRFEVRDFAPGRYVARDEDGNTVAFVVTAGEESALVQEGADPYAREGREMSGAGSTSGTYVQPIEVENVGVRPAQVAEGEMVRPPAGEVRRPGAELGSDAAVVPGQPGAPIVQEGVLGPSAYLPIDGRQEFDPSPGALEARREDETSGEIGLDDPHGWLKQGGGTLPVGARGRMEDAQQVDRTQTRFKTGALPKGDTVPPPQNAPLVQPLEDVAHDDEERFAKGGPPTEARAEAAAPDQPQSPDAAPADEEPQASAEETARANSEQQVESEDQKRKRSAAAKKAAETRKRRAKVNAARRAAKK